MSQHAEQNLAIRRMYSAIERQQSRLITHRRQLQMEMRVVRDEREQRRRDMETRYITELNDSSDSEEVTIMVTSRLPLLLHVCSMIDEREVRSGWK